MMGVLFLLQMDSAFFTISIMLGTDRARPTPHITNKRTDPLKNHLLTIYGSTKLPAQAGTGLLCPHPQILPLHHEPAFSMNFKLSRKWTASCNLLK